ncbi:MAG: hypothetical protein AABY03_02180, partial [Nanoarchaeota archaeon]
GVQGGAGNKRLIETNIKKGSIIIDGKYDKIIFQMETDYIYSEQGQNVNIGNIVAVTEDIGATNIILLNSNYNYNITNNGRDENKTIEDSTTPYTVSIENKGEDSSGKIIVDFVVN